jgi:putative hemolysin
MVKELVRPAAGRPQPAAEGLTVRLARSRAEVEACQALRYQVFHEEMGAKSGDLIRRRKLDVDAYDADCDHLIAVDPTHPGNMGIVATYRLIRSHVAERVGCFYTATEFDIDALVSRGGNLLELGRSCVGAGHRTRAVMQMMWQGIAGYVADHQIDVMFGCASLPGTDVEAMSPVLSYLHHNHLAPADWRPVARDHVRAPFEPGPAPDSDQRRAFAALPPLLKGYLRLGGEVGEGAVLDRDFNTTDVCLIVRTETITSRYRNHYLDKGAA